MLQMLKKMKYRPQSGVWELTLRCNMNCLHCGSRAGRPRGDELTVDELLRVADELGELECQSITLSGGEPLMRKEWPLVAARLAKHGVAVNMISNGYIFGERELRTAKAVGMKNMAFSVDGNEEIHNKIRAKSKAYDRVMHAVDLCVKANYPPAVVTHITNANIPIIEDMLKDLIDRGVTMWQVQTGFEAGNLSDHPELVLAPDAFATVIPMIARLIEKYGDKIRIEAADDVGYYTEEDEIIRQNGEFADYWLGCQAGLRVIGIEANGNIKGCLSMQSDEFVEGNIREESLKEIWFKEGNFAYTRQFKVDNLGGFCRTCDFNEICRGGCSWNGHLHGKAEGKFANRYCLYQVRELKKGSSS